MNGDTMTARIVDFAARCPFCGKSHHRAAYLTDPKGQTVAVAAEYFTCCGHEFGFSVRRTFSAFLSGKVQGVTA